MVKWAEVSEGGLMRQGEGGGDGSNGGRGWGGRGEATNYHLEDEGCKEEKGMGRHFKGKE